MLNIQNLVVPAQANRTLIPESCSIALSRATDRLHSLRADFCQIIRDSPTVLVFAHQSPLLIGRSTSAQHSQWDLRRISAPSLDILRLSCPILCSLHIWRDGDIPATTLESRIPGTYAENTVLKADE